jgi:hypothetical protein
MDKTGLSILTYAFASTDEPGLSVPGLWFRERLDGKENVNRGDQHVLSMVFYRFGICQDLAKLTLSYHHASVEGDEIFRMVLLKYLNYAPVIDKWWLLFRYGFIWEWDVRKVTDMSCAFRKSYQSVDISSWNVCQVRTMNSMFAYNSRFNYPLENWNVEQVVDMEYMFAGTTSFNQPLEKWNMSKVKTMGNMFYYASAFNQPLGKFRIVKN